MLSVGKSGDWAKAKLLSTTLKSTMKLSADPGFSSLALKGESLMKRYIRKQPTSWPALSTKYKQGKLRQGKSDKMLIRTSSMLLSIKGFSANSNAYIGVKRNAENDEGEKLANIAAIMEKGSKVRNIPARPFIEPVYKHLIRRIEKDGLFHKYLKMEMERKYGIKL
ncbi:MAG: hypothetical protein CL843_09445 [Crocinitomicaceae bacterium]|nr:hypothetical protein [Crocinitomicaceae bacterium]|tara:strand:+ start:10039 stop:10536 length:498 start_codon:yes stop_codon:yes gene_type:complete